MHLVTPKRKILIRTLGEEVIMHKFLFLVTSLKLNLRVSSTGAIPHMSLQIDY